MRLLHLTNGIAVSGYILRWAFSDAVDFDGAAGRTCRSCATGGQGASVGQPKISRPAFEDLEFDGGWPNLLRASYMIENSTVARLAVAWLVGAFTPLELRAQIIVGEFLLGDDVAEFLSGNMNNTFLHPEHLVGIMIQSLRLQKSIEVFEIDALK